MPHVFHALFPKANEAAEALREIHYARQHDFRGAELHVTLQRGHLDAERVPLGSTNGGYRFLFGAVLGAMLGTMAGFGLLWVGIMTAPLGIGLTALLGAIAGGLGGALSGVGSPDTALELLTHDMNGTDVAISFSLTDADFVSRAATICAQHGARVELRKHQLVA